MFLLFILFINSCFEKVPKELLKNVKCKVAVCSLVGSRSHINHLLELIDQLDRGRCSSYYLSTTEKKVFTNGRNTTLYDLGVGTTYSESLSVFNGDKGLRTLRRDIELNLYSRLYRSYLFFFEIKSALQHIKPNLVICDFYATACIDAARAYKINVIVGIQTFYREELYRDKYFKKADKNKGFTINYFYKAKSIIPDIIDNFYLARSKYRLKSIRFMYNQYVCSVFICNPKTMVLSNSFIGFELPEVSSKSIVLHGPLLKSMNTKISDWHYKMKSCQRAVYIAFGSYISLKAKLINVLMELVKKLYSQNTIDCLAWGYGNTDLKEVKIGLEKLPKTLNVDTKKWHNQQQILNDKRTVLFFTHGGYQSVIESVLGKTPMIVFPFCGDQFETGKKVEILKVGYHFAYDKTSANELFQYSNYLILSNNTKRDMKKAYVLFYYNSFKTSSAKKWLEKNALVSMMLRNKPKI